MPPRFVHTPLAFFFETPLTFPAKAYSPLGAMIGSAKLENFASGKPGTAPPCTAGRLVPPAAPWVKIAFTFFFFLPDPDPALMRATTAPLSLTAGAPPDA